MAVERFGIGVVLILACCMLQAQTPRPFPQPAKPSSPGTNQPANPVPPATIAPGPKPLPAAEIPTEATLGVPIYPNAQYITSYDAGRGQRFYLFGVSAPFAEMVAYYRKVLKQNGSELFLTPPTHQFEIGRFREETMAFPPSVTIKDYTWSGSAGYPNPRRGQPERFPTIIQIVPTPPGAQQDR
jgi:hypothetical protein